MANISKNTNRYPGTDNTPWKVTDNNGKEVLAVGGKDAPRFTGYKDARHAGNQYTAEHGVHTHAVRV